MEGLLEGIKVVDMGHVVAVPATGRILSDWGADVIKIEPLFGDLLRGWTRNGGVDKLLQYQGGEVHFQFEALNTGKKSIALDLRQDSGRAILNKIVEKSDIFISNYEMESLKKLKADFQTLSKVNPMLIYAVLTGYGSFGPDRNDRGFDMSAGWAVENRDL